MPIDPDWQAKKDEWDRHLETHTIMLTGGAHKLTCPLCPDEHPVCRFAAGSLHCVNVGCGNPHHGRPTTEVPPF